MDKKYCIYCGQENTAEATQCTNCGKELDPRENLLVDFLVKRTKDKVKGDAETTVFEAIKDFLLSHLYGVAMTVSFVAAAAVTVSAVAAPVKAVDHRQLESYVAKNNLVGYIYGNIGDEPGGLGGDPDYSEEQYMEAFGPDNIVDDSGVTDSEYNMQYNMAVHDLVTAYEIETMNFQVLDANGNLVDTNPDKYRLPASYGYNGAHMLSPALPVYLPEADERGAKGKTEFDPNNFQREISRVLYKDGYTVGECLVQAEFRKVSDQSLVASYKYIVVAVLVEGQWLVAEDYVYDVYMETVGKGEDVVVNGIDTYDVMDFAREYAAIMQDGNDASNMWIDPVFGYTGTHQLSYDEAFVYDESASEKALDYSVETEYGNFERDISRQLMEEGYPVAECYFREQKVKKGTYELEGERAYIVVCALIDGQWCVVDDVYTTPRY